MTEFTWRRVIIRIDTLCEGSITRFIVDGSPTSGDLISVIKEHYSTVQGLVVWNFTDDDVTQYTIRDMQAVAVCAANRQVFDVLFRQAYSQSKRNKAQLSAIILDIDYFKQINDTYGHPTEDVVLKTLTQIIKQSIRESDILFRWGGCEFLIILPE